MKLSPNDLCPCGSGLKYKKCCRMLHHGLPAQSPEALMRSRYAAYALNNVEYIIATTHPDSPHYSSDREAWRREIETFCKETTFAGLDILAVEPDTVTFRATLFQNARDVSFTERSLFKQYNGRWMYQSAQA
jgi:SEC-C motif-containing protein